MINNKYLALYIGKSQNTRTHTHTHTHTHTKSSRCLSFLPDCNTIQGLRQGLDTKKQRTNILQEIQYPKIKLVETIFLFFFSLKIFTYSNIFHTSSLI